MNKYFVERDGGTYLVVTYGRYTEWVDGRFTFGQAEAMAWLLNHLHDGHDVGWRPKNQEVFALYSGSTEGI